MSRHTNCHLPGIKKTKIPVPIKKNKVVSIPVTAEDMANVQDDIANLNIGQKAIQKTVLEMHELNTAALATCIQNTHEMKALNVRGNNHFHFDHRIPLSIPVTIAEMAAVQYQVQKMQVVQSGNVETVLELEELNKGASAKVSETETMKEENAPNVRGNSEELKKNDDYSILLSINSLLLVSLLNTLRGI